MVDPIAAAVRAAYEDAARVMGTLARCRDRYIAAGVTSYGSLTETAQAAILARADEVAQPWQPGKTAPKDGAKFLALPWTENVDDASVTWWVVGDDRWANWEWSDPPEWWMPLPPPPKGGEG